MSEFLFDVPLIATMRLEEDSLDEAREDLASIVGFTVHVDVPGGEITEISLGIPATSINRLVPVEVDGESVDAGGSADIERDSLITNAALLMMDGNPMPTIDESEYLRGIVELLADTLHLTDVEMDDRKDFVEGKIRARHVELSASPTDTQGTEF